MGSGQMRLSVVVALVVCACDAQVTSSYRGERMAEIRGNIVSENVHLKHYLNTTWVSLPSSRARIAARSTW